MILVVLRVLDVPEVLKVLVLRVLVLKVLVLQVQQRVWH